MTVAIFSFIAILLIKEFINKLHWEILLIFKKLSSLSIQCLAKFNIWLVNITSIIFKQNNTGPQLF